MLTAALLIGAGIVVTTESPARSEIMQVSQQNWSTLTIEAFPAAGSAGASGSGSGGASGSPMISRRVLHEQQQYGAQTAACYTELALSTDGKGGLELTILSNAPTAAIAGRAWVLRLHLLPGQRLVTASTKVDGV